MTRRQFAGLFVLCLAVLMVAIDATVISVAVPSITEQLRPDYNQILWIGDIYSFVIAGLLITMGNLGDRIGRKRLLLISSLAFGAAAQDALEQCRQALKPGGQLFGVWHALDNLKSEHAHGPQNPDVLPSVESLTALCGRLGLEVITCENRDGKVRTDAGPMPSVTVVLFARKPL